MSTEERLERMRQHFDNISIEEFEQKMRSAGMGKISCAEEDGFVLAGPKRKNIVERIVDWIGEHYGIVMTTIWAAALIVIICAMWLAGKGKIPVW